MDRYFNQQKEVNQMKRIRWGVLSTARIGTETVIPAMQLGEYCTVAAIASRQLEKAQAAARKLDIKKAYGSYEELLSDPDIDAVYIPLPNHLHVPWTIKALNAGKHVLCEKPIGLSAAEAQKLLSVARKFPRLKVMEAFMYRHHPQWQWAKQKVNEGKIGEVRTIQSFFSYYNNDPDNIRNKADIGGGGLMDIGCYCISLSRFIFGAEPWRVCGIMEEFMYRHHPQWLWAKQRVTEGKIGELRTIQTFFSYYNTDPDNIRNKADVGGGGLMDIGCYCISLSRFIFGAEPVSYTHLTLPTILLV